MAPTVPIEYSKRGDLITSFKKSSVGKMGKARKFSKRHSSGLGSDKHNNVDTVTEADGFGCVDTEIAASNLNLDSYDRFGVPYQVFSLSKLSSLEKSSLEMRFKSELERVKILQKRIASLHMNGSLVSPSSNIRSFSEGNRKRGGKKRSCTKPPLDSANVKLMKQCENLLNKLMTHPHGWVFSTPVDVVELNIPDYLDVIKHPMDLGTVKSKLLTEEYSSPLGFAADVRLTFSNAKTYNPVGNDVHTMADMLSKLFESKWKPIEKKVPVVIDTHVHSMSSVYNGPKTHAPPPSKKRKTTPAETKAIQEEPVKIAMPVVDKQKLSFELEDLIAELPNSIIEFLRIQSCNGTQTDDDEIEIDIDALSYDTLLTLRSMLDDYLLDRQKHKERAEPCEMELQNESGISNLSVQPPQGVEVVDEDVDIGENDPPMTRYPPVQIEIEETTTRPDKRTSSSSSSGSSSSDSDSGSSASESDGEKATGTAVSPKDVLTSQVNTELRTKDIGDLDNRDYFLSGSNRVERYFESKEENPVLADSHLEGDAPHGRQVSPGKLYRTAMLKKRFADTILKAQEKTLDKGEKQDPEHLRLQKEELEKRKIDEKGRLLAEAKAAEKACKKAEADAASEAKRKRALEREAARLALQKLEKNVNFQENCQFLDDLEMLRCGDAENVESLIDEASPDLSQDNLGRFKFQGNSNPLEQLGLYMKMDDEDDEEAEPQTAVSLDDAEKENNTKQENNVEIENDVEEGEVD